jgi:putative restriction endonuclease
MARVFGQIPGVEVGATFINRMALSTAGVHRQTQAGISGGKDGADSIVVSGGYVDDDDRGAVIIYTGQGGNDPNTKKQIADQKFDRGNFGLARSCDLGLPVRVTRGKGGDKATSPTAGYRYDGLFTVSEYWQETGRHGFQIWRFKLEQISGQTSFNTHASAVAVTEEVPGSSEPAPRVESVVQRIVRNTEMSGRVKAANRYKCQVCGIVLETRTGPYAEGAHIRPIGTPHNGPDTEDNLLCLCPNDHVLFDRLAIFIDEQLDVRRSSDKVKLGSLLIPAGRPSSEHITYHRNCCIGPDA